jgi:hypothetical protein
LNERQRPIIIIIIIIIIDVIDQHRDEGNFSGATTNICTDGVVSLTRCYHTNEQRGWNVPAADLV